VQSNDSFNEYVRATIESGIKPLEILYYPIVDIEEGFPIAFRCKTLIHSVIEGDLRDIDYSYVSDVRNVGINLLRHQIRHLINAYKRFNENEIEIEYLSIRCPKELPDEASLYNIVKEELSRYPWFIPSKMCLEFDSELLNIDDKKAKETILDMKLLKVKTALIGCGKDDFLISKLIDVTPDYVYLDERTTSYAGSRDKPTYLRSLVEYLKSMGISVIAEGKEEFRKPLRNTDCIGFYNIDVLPKSLDEALIVEEEE